MNTETMQFDPSPTRFRLFFLRGRLAPGHHDSQRTGGCPLGYKNPRWGPLLPSQCWIPPLFFPAVMRCFTALLICGVLAPASARARDPDLDASNEDLFVALAAAAALSVFGNMAGGDREGCKKIVPLDPCLPP